MTANHRIRFMDNQFATEANLTASSELASFPATNILNQSRSMVWKPAGNFEITDSNKKLYINDGSDLTVTLIKGAYTYATLAAHIAVMLNLSSSLWSCSYDFGVTNKFTISRSSGTAILRLSQTSSACWDTLGYTGAVNMMAGQAHEQRNHTSEWLEIDVLQAQQLGFFGLIGPISQALTVSMAGVMRVRANMSSYWFDPPIDVTPEVSDRGAYRFFDDITDTIYRYMRVEIIDRLNPVGPEGFSFGYLYFGDYRTVTQSNVAQGFTKGTLDPSVKQRSRSGQQFSSIQPKYRVFDGCEMMNLVAAERRQLEQTFFSLGQTEQFFTSLDPTLVVSTTLDEMTFYSRFASDPQLPHLIRDYYTKKFVLEEAV